MDESAISPEVVAERGYQTIARPPQNPDPRDVLRRHSIPSWGFAEDSDFPGLLIPVYGPLGDRVGATWKPRRPVRPRHDKGKPVKYVTPKGAVGRMVSLDVHPRHRSTIVDVGAPLWVTEGVKKADSLTSHLAPSVAVVALSGVFNWRTQFGTLGQWEDIPLRGRQVVICFDSDAADKPAVRNAMERFGRWLVSRGAHPKFLVTPAVVGETQTKGVDDFFAAGGTLDTLAAAARDRPPAEVRSADFTDAVLADRLANELLGGRFIHTPGLGWLEWDGGRWEAVDEDRPMEEFRQYADRQYREAGAAGPERKADVDGWFGVLSRSRRNPVLADARGIDGIRVRASNLDADRDVLNTPDGLVDLRTGVLTPASPDDFCTKSTAVPYVPGATHPDWTAALLALPDDVRGWFQLRMGQATTGHAAASDILPICQGGGENGKSTVVSAVVAALGSYARLVSTKLLVGGKDGEPGGTEQVDLLGLRLALLEETAEAARLDVQALKAVVGTEWITARRLYKDTVTFDVTHSLVLSTNHVPVVTASDHAAWRRLKLVRFPYRFRKPSEPLTGPDDRRGDPGLRDRCKSDPAVQRAVLAWLVEGAMQWYAQETTDIPNPPRVEADTQAWRAESDPMVGYAADRLVFEPGRHVQSAEMWEDVNAWLAGRGHRPWSMQTFSARFSALDHVSRRLVERRQVRAASEPGLSRPDRAVVPVPARYWAWTGVRFRTPADDAAETLAAVPESVTDVPAAPAPPPPVDPITDLLDAAAQPYEPESCPDCGTPTELVRGLWFACPSCTPQSFTAS